MGGNYSSGNDGVGGAIEGRHEDKGDFSNTKEVGGFAFGAFRCLNQAIRRSTVLMQVYMH